MGQPHSRSLLPRDTPRSQPIGTESAPRGNVCREQALEDTAMIPDLEVQQLVHDDVVLKLVPFLQ